MSGYSIVTGGGISRVNYNFEVIADGTIASVFAANGVTDNAGFVTAIYNSSASPVTLTAGSIVNTLSYPTQTTATDIVIPAEGTVVIQTVVAAADYVVQGFNGGTTYVPYKYSKEWHVDPVNGSDTNVGGEETPFETVAHALSVAAAGEAIILHSGTYATPIVSNIGDLDFIGYGGTGAVVVDSLTITNAGATNTLSSLSIGTLTISGASTSVGIVNCLIATALDIADTTSVEILSSNMETAAATTLTTTGGFTSYGSTISNVSTSAGATVVAYSSTLSFDAADQNGNVVLRGCSVRNTAANPFGISTAAGSNLTAVNTQFLNSGGFVGDVISVAGNYELKAANYNKTGSSITGTPNSVDTSVFDSLGFVTQPATVASPTTLLSLDADENVGVLTNASTLTTIGTTAIKPFSTSTTLAGLNSVTVTADPTLALQLATKQYVDTVAGGLNPLAPALAATTADVTLSGEQTIDGVALVTGNRVLVKNQTLPQENGVYIVDAGAWTYATDANTWADYVNASVLVTSGTANAGSTWIQTAPAGGTLGTTPMVWNQLSGAITYIGGTGISVVGTTISLDDTTVTPATYGSAGTVPVITVNQQGQITLAIGAGIVAPNLAGGTAGTIPYQSAANTTLFTSVGTAGQVLTSNGAGAPTWTSAPSPALTTNQIGFGNASNQLAGSTSFTYNSGTGVFTSSAADALIHGITIGTGNGSIANNTAVGNTALSANSSGSNNVAIGFKSLNLNTSGANNTSVGSNALSKAASANGNTAVGYNAGAAQTSGGGTMVGYNAGSVTTAANGTFFGSSSGAAVTIGVNNNFFGYNSGSAVTTGNNNTVIGSYTGSTGPISLGGNNWIVLSDGAGNVPVYWNGSTDAMYVNGTPGTAGQVLTSAGSGATPTWSNAVTTALSGGTANSIPYQSAPGTTTFLSAGTAGQVLTTQGVGSAPTFTSVVNSFSGGTTGLLPSTGTTGDVTLSGTLGTANGGTGLTTVGSNGQVLTSNGTTLSWQTPAAGGSLTNTYVGYGNGANALTGNNNFTFNAVSNQLTISGDVFIGGVRFGRGAGLISTNVAAGATALASNTTGSVNVAVGNLAMNNNQTGTGNVAVGSNALQNPTSPGTTTAIGYNSLKTASGDGNTAIGYQSGGSVTTGSYNTIVGAHTGSTAPISATGSNWIVLSDGAGNVPVYWKGTTSEMFVGGSSGSAGQVLTSNGAGVAPSWTAPGAASSATNLAGGSIGTIPYQSATGTTAMLAAGTTGQALISNGAAAPSWGIPAKAVSLSAGAANQIPYQSAAGTTAYLATGTSGQSLISGGSGAAPSWGTPSLATAATNVSGGAAGQIVFQSAANTTGFTAAGTTGQSLLSAGTGTPTWGTPALATTATNLAGGSAGTIPYQTASGATAQLAAGTSGQVLQSNGAAAPSWVTIPSGSAGYFQATALQTSTNPLSPAGNGLYGINGFGDNAPICYIDNSYNYNFGVASNQTDLYVNTAKDIWLMAGASKVGSSGPAARLLQSGQFRVGYPEQNRNPVGYGAARMIVNGYDGTGTDGLVVATPNANNCVNVGKVPNTTGGTGASGTFMAFIGIGTSSTATYGGISVSGSGCVYNTSSDARLKENVVEITNGLDKVKALRPVSYDWIDNDKSDIGFIAQEAELVVPESVSPPIEGEPSREYYQMDLSRLVPVLTAAIKEQQAIIESLQARLDKAGL